VLATNRCARTQVKAGDKTVNVDAREASQHIKNVVGMNGGKNQVAGQAD